MGGNLNSILTRISLNQLLESIASKLNNGKDYSEIIRKAWAQTSQTMLHVLTQIHNGCHLYDSYSRLAAEVREKDWSKPNYESFALNVLKYLSTFHLNILINEYTFLPWFNFE